MSAEEIRKAIDAEIKSQGLDDIDDETRRDWQKVCTRLLESGEFVSKSELRENSQSWFIRVGDMQFTFSDPRDAKYRKKPCC